MKIKAMEWIFKLCMAIQFEDGIEHLLSENMSPPISPSLQLHMDIKPLT